MICCPKQQKSNIETAQSLLNFFVDNFQTIFGSNSVSFNVHNLLHLKESIEFVDDPMSCTSYPFENYLQFLKKSVKKPTQILEQLFRRLVEGKFNVSSTENGFNNAGTKYTFNNCTLTTKNPDNVCYLKNYVPLKIVKFLHDEEGSVVCQHFSNIRSFYKEPCNSKSLGIYLVDEKNSNNEETFLIKDIECKAMALPYDEDLVLIPILHGCH